MAAKKLTPDELEALRNRWSYATVTDDAIEAAQSIEEDELERPQSYIKDRLVHEKLLDQLTQRNEQRNKIFRLATWYCWVSLLLLVVIVDVQITGRIVTRDFSVFDGNELQILVVGVFGQFVGLLYIITKSLYDDKNFKDLFKGNMKK